MDTQRSRRKIIFLAMGEQLDQMLQIQEAVVDGSGRQHKHLFLAAGFHHIKQLAISVRGTVTEMVRFVYHHDFGLLGDLPHQVFISFKKQIGMVDDLEGVEALEDFRDILFDRSFPDGDSGCSWDHQDYVFAFFLHKSLDQHQANKGLAETNAVAEEGTRITVGNLHKAVITILLILGKALVHNGIMVFPFRNCLLATLEKLVHGSEVYIIGAELSAVIFNYAKDCLSDISPFIPFFLEPFLELCNLIIHLDIKLYVFCQTGVCEVAGTHKGIAVRNIHRSDELISVIIAEICNICLCVEFSLVKDPTLNFPTLYSFDDSRNADEKLIVFLLSVHTIFQMREKCFYNSINNLFCPLCDFITKDDADFI